MYCCRVDVVEDEVVVVRKQGMSVGLVPLIEYGVFCQCVVVLLLVEEFVTVFAIGVRKKPSKPCAVTCS